MEWRLGGELVVMVISTLASCWWREEFSEWVCTWGGVDCDL